MHDHVASHLLFRILGLALCTAGCAADSASEGSEFRIRELPGGGVEVSNTGEGAWEESGGWTVQETLRLGATEGEGPDVFGLIAAVEGDAAGRTHVFDSHAVELRVFGPDGTFLSRFGRRGGGPGEFQGVLGMSLSPQGALWLVDGPNSRYTVLQDGEVETYRRPSGVYRLPWLGGFSRDGRLWDAMVLPEQGAALVAIGAGGTPRDTLPLALPALDHPRRGSIELPLPYAPRALWTFDPRGFVWLANSHEYRLAQITLDGDTARVVTLDRTPPPLSAEQTDSVRRYGRNLEAEFGVSVRDDMIPSSAAMLRWFFVDDTGHLFVARATSDPVRWLDAFDPEGRYLGEVELPFALHPGFKPLVRDGSLYGLTEDLVGAPVVVRGRILHGDGS